jgi:hypothetical protein
MKARNVFLSTLLIGVGCASSGGGGGSQPVHEAPAPAAPAGEGGEAVSAGSSGGGDEHQPEMVHTGKKLNLSWADAQDRYSKKGNKCSGGDAPEQAIGAPDQKNEMTQGHDHLVIYGFHYKEGTLIIRCRNDHVDSTRVLSK